MRQIFAKQAVYKRAGNCGKQKEDQNCVSTTQDDEHGPRANTSQCPAQAENRSANDISGSVPVLVGDSDLFTIHRLHMGSLDPLNDQDTHSNGGENDPVHVKALEVEHFIDPKPRHGFCLVQSHSEKKADQDVFG